MLCARPLAFTELPHSPSGPETPQAPTITRPAATPAPTITADPPTTELKPAPVVAPTPPPPTQPPVSGQPANEQAEVAAALASVVRILDDIVEQAVGKGIADAFARLERSHAEDLSALAERFEAALERQDKRHHQLLERQDARLEELLTIHAKARAEDLRAALLEVHQTHENTTIPAAIEELQETMRLGFGELRASLNQGNHELTRLRTECAALTSALSRLVRPADPLPAEPRYGSPPPPSPPHPTPARSPPIREDRATATRRLDALHDDDDANDDDPHDQPSRPLRYRPPDDNAEPSHAQEASA